jgi:glycosyltransferase involved in cell wall biosynthesis
MINPLISVVIPARNRERTIGYCLNSVLSQSFTNFEVIIVDDGSSDTTCSVVQNYCDPRVRLLKHKYPQGAQTARNTGIKAAKGKWIAFHDSDDEWLPEKLEKQLYILESRDWDERLVVHADMYRYFPETDNSEHWKLPKMNGDSSYLAVLKSPGPLFPTMIVSKSVLIKIGLLDEKVPSYQEWETAIRLAKICEFIHLPEPLAIYWLHREETISKNKRGDIDGYCYVIEKHQDEICRVAGDYFWFRHLSIVALRCLRFGFLDDAKIILNQLPLLSIWHWRTKIFFYLASFKLNHD